MATSPRIGLVGAGALGGYVGARLAASGADVHFLLRSDYEAVRAQGYQIRFRDREPLQVHPVAAYPTPEALGPCDWVIIGLKTTRNEALRTLLPPLLQPGTVLITLQNGLGNVEFLEALAPGHPIVGATCQIGVTRTAPGLIESFVPGGGTMQVAAAHTGAEAPVNALADLLSRAGIATKARPHLQEILWRKLMWNVPFNGLAVAAGGRDTAQLLADPEMEALARALMRELRAGALALDIPIEAEFVDKLIEFTRPMPPYRPSSLIDFETGRELEVEAIFGEPCRRAEAAGVEVPRLRMLYTLLRALSPAGD